MDDNATTGGLLVLLIVLVGVASAVRFPQTACRRCEGSGRRFEAGGRHWRACRTCMGTGRTTRWLYHLVRLFGLRPPM